MGSVVPCLCESRVEDFFFTFSKLTSNMISALANDPCTHLDDRQLYGIRF